LYPSIASPASNAGIPNGVNGVRIPKIPMSTSPIPATLRASLLNSIKVVVFIEYIYTSNPYLWTKLILFTTTSIMSKVPMNP